MCIRSHQETILSNLEFLFQNSIHFQPGSSPNIRHRQEYMGLVCLQRHPHIGVEDILVGPHSVEAWAASVAVLAHQADQLVHLVCL